MLTAATLYEAVAAALSALRGHEWAGEIGKGLTEVTVRVRQPEVTHTVRQGFRELVKRAGPDTCRSRSQVPPTAELNIDIQQMGNVIKVVDRDRAGRQRH